MLFYDANYGNEVVWLGSELEAKGLAYNGGFPFPVEQLMPWQELRMAPAHWKQDGLLALEEERRGLPDLGDWSEE